MLVFRERGIKLATRKLAAVFGAAFLRVRVAIIESL